MTKQLLTKKILSIIAIILVILVTLYFLSNTLLGNLWGKTIGQLTPGASKQTFTLKGELPQHFTLDIIGYYYSDSDQDCLRYSQQAGKKISYRTGIKETITMPHQGNYQVNIPTSYSEEGCHLPIQTVKIIAYNHYGENLKEESMEQWGASLNFVDSGYLKDEVPHFQQGQAKVYHSRCYNSFRLMADKSLLKILGCYAADEKWQWPTEGKIPKVYDVVRRDELANQLIEVNFRLDSKDDKPYFKGSWKKTEKGWRPCVGKGDNPILGFCHLAPEKYMTFQIDGKTCTVYPNCTE